MVEFPHGLASDHSSRRPSILVVAADVGMGRSILLDLQAEPFELAVVSDFDEAIADVHRHRPDLIIANDGSANGRGIELTKGLRADPRTAVLPVIVLGDGSSADAVAALDAGADDYINKPLDAAEFLARIRSVLRRGRESLDASPMTGLPGNTRIMGEISKCLDSHDAWAVCMIDIDRFKLVTDTMGFYRGGQFILALKDSLIQAAAKINKPPPFVGHVGGDDFVVVCTPDQVKPFSHLAIHAFLSATDKLYDPTVTKRGFMEQLLRNGSVRRVNLVTVSVGVALSTSRNYLNAAEVISGAWAMMEVAKTQPGCYVAIDRRSPTDDNGQVAEERAK